MNITSKNYDLSAKDNTSFGKLKIKVTGKEFKNSPQDKQLIIDTIRNNKGIQRFFNNHNGKITVISGCEMTPKTYDYAECLKKVPGRSLPFDQFSLNVPNYNTYIKCEYNRAFALRNLFKKPVWVEAGIKNSKEILSWKTCIDYTIKLINENLADTLNNCEARRLKIEKP